MQTFFTILLILLGIGLVAMIVSFVPQPTPQGKTMKARIYDGGNRLELDGYGFVLALIHSDEKETD